MSKDLLVENKPAIGQSLLPVVKAQDKKTRAFLRKHPRGYAIVIKKSARKLFLYLNGAAVKGAVFDLRNYDPKFLDVAGPRNTSLSFPAHISLGYDFETGTSPLGPKKEVGDAKVPEGEYFICELNLNKSKYTYGLTISYPNPKDARDGLKRGAISKTKFDRLVRAYKNWDCPPGSPLGSEIQIHGPSNNSSTDIRENIKNSTAPEKDEKMPDWTAGCIATGFRTITYLARTIPLKTPILILP